MARALVLPLPAGGVKAKRKGKPRGRPWKRGEAPIGNRWKKGQSGNPAGFPKSLETMRVTCLEVGADFLERARRLGFSAADVALMQAIWDRAGLTVPKATGSDAGAVPKRVIVEFEPDDT